LKLLYTSVPFINFPTIRPLEATPLSVSTSIFNFNLNFAVVLPNKKVILPQGRDIVMNAPRGTKVYNADKTREMLDSMMFNDQLNNILSSNGIGSSFQPNNTTLNDQNIVSELREVVKAIDGIPVPSSRITNGDLENFIETNTTRIKQTNARRTFTPRNT